MPEDPGSHAEVRTHAPTLLGADQPGEQGEVRVWAPNPWRLKARLLAELGLVIFWVGLYLLLRYIHAATGHLDALSGQTDPQNAPSDQWLCGVMYGVLAISGIISAVGAYRLLRRPRYVTTDDAGIGITTRQGSRSLRWSEIRSARGRSRITLRTTDGKLRIEMAGYSRAVARELFALIVNRANLYRDPHELHQFAPEEQVRDWFRARSKDPKLQRPPLPAMQKPGRDRFAVVEFVLTILAIPIFALSPLWIGLWAWSVFLSFEISFPLAQQRQGVGGMNEMLSQLRGDGNRRSPEGKSASAWVWTDQAPGSDLAAPSVPGYRTLAVRAEWAPLSRIGVSQNLYWYVITFSLPAHQHRFPSTVLTALKSGERVSYSVARRPNDIKEFGGVYSDVYSNRWWKLLDMAKPDRSVAEAPPRSWRLAGVSVYDNRPITWIKFTNAPVREIYMPADSQHPAAAVAAWLPGHFNADQLNCDVIYRDGGIHHLHLSPIPSLARRPPQRDEGYREDAAEMGEGIAGRTDLVGVKTLAVEETERMKAEG